MYSFAQRSDCTVVDEPFYAYYLLKTGKDHPGRQETLSSQSGDALVVLSELSKIQSHPVLFVKNMAKHMAGIDQEEWTDFVEVLLIRDPAQLISSFQQVIPNPKMDDIGLLEELKIFKSARIAGKSPIVLDSGEVLKDPETVLSQLCDCLQIPFDPGMLAWPAGAKSFDGVWAPYWYKNVRASTGFAKQATSSRPLPEHCRALYEQARPLYDQLYLHALKA